MNTTQHTPEITLDIISDVVCPWCYIGKRNLQTALQRLAQEQPQLQVKVRWLPYFLDPNTPVQGTPYRAYLEKKFGGTAQLEAAWARVTEAGEQAGITFAFDKIALRANTLNAHRLIHRAQQQGDAETLVEALFYAHFEQGANLNDVDVLANIAASCGDDDAQVRNYLNSAEARDAVIQQAAQAQQSGVTGVPFFIFNQQYAVSGGQPPEAFLDIIQQVQNKG